MIDPWRSAAAAAVAEAFQLGSALGDLQPVAGGRSHLMWRLRTTTGWWAAKQFNRSRERWWMDGFEIAAEVEVVAFRHGINMPRPIAPRAQAPSRSEGSDGAGTRLLADVKVDGAVASFVVHEWCSGAPLGDVGVPPDVLRWVGETLAALHSLPITLDFADAVQYGPHELQEWQEWLDDPPDQVSPDFVGQVRAFLPDIAEAKEIADRAWLQVGDQLTPVFTHGDVKPDNVLLTSSTPVLVDWEGAGPDYAEWEAARTAVAFSRSPDGWARDSFEQVLRAYEASGGRPIPPAPGSFAGLLRRQLGASAYLLWRALGHRPVTAAERAAAHDHTLQTLEDLRASVAQLEPWTHWLEDLA